MSTAAKPDFLLLSRREIAAAMDFTGYVAAVEAAFQALGEGRALAPAASSIAVPGGAFHAKGAALSIEGRLFVAVKVNGNFPGNPQARGLPTVQGAVYLADGSDGRPLALLDSIEVTIQRTAAATAVAARHLARPQSRRLAICGVGAQCRAQLAAIRHACAIEQVLLWDIDDDAAQRMARSLAAETGLAVRATSELAAIAGSDVIVTCSSARQAFLDPSLVAPGCFVAAVGADNPDKQEISPALFPKATVVVDSREQCAEIGDLHHALAAGTIRSDEVHASLGEVVAGQRAGRRHADEIVLFDSTGLGLQDVAAAAAIWIRARAAAIGTAYALA